VRGLANVKEAWLFPRSDRKTYNLSWVGKSAGLPAIEASEGFLAPIFGRVEQLL